jgi:hypothetical protein
MAAQSDGGSGGVFGQAGMTIQRRDAENAEISAEKKAKRHGDVL